MNSETLKRRRQAKYSAERRRRLIAVWTAAVVVLLAAVTVVDANPILNAVTRSGSHHPRKHQARWKHRKHHSSVGMKTAIVRPPEGGANPPVTQAPAEAPPAGEVAPPLPAVPPAEVAAPPAEVAAPPVEAPQTPVEEPAPPVQAPPAEEVVPPTQPPAPPVKESPPPVEIPMAPPAEEPAPPAAEPPAAEPPASEPVDTPPPLFEGSEVDNFAQVQAAPAAITEVLDPLGSGETVLKMTVDDDDVAPITPTDNPRAQLLSPTLIKNGDEIWLKTKFLLPTNFPTVTGWMSLVSIYGPPFKGSSPWQIGVNGNNLSWQRNGTYGYDVPWETPLQKGRWIELLLHERFASDGWVEMWIDGQPVTFFGPGSYNPSGHSQTQKLEMATRDSSNNGGDNAAKIMQYREAGMFETASAYFGALLLGETQASVEG